MRRIYIFNKEKNFVPKKKEKKKENFVYLRNKKNGN